MKVKSILLNILARHIVISQAIARSHFFEIHRHNNWIGTINYIICNINYALGCIKEVYIIYYNQEDAIQTRRHKSNQNIGRWTASKYF